MPAIYEVGSKIGPYNVELLEITKVTSYGHRYGKFLCPVCNKNTFESKIYHVSSGATFRCKECRIEARTGINNNNFRDLTGQTFGKLTVISLVGSDPAILGRNHNQKKSIWKCKCACGREKLTTGNELVRNMVSSCGHCQLNSNGEYKIKTILDSINIKHTCQYRFSDCIDIHPLPFDFYLPDYNCCIEYDGTSHYKSNPYGSWCTEESVKKTQEHDNIKDQYCKDNNIKLIRIPYWDYDKIDKDYLLDKINS